MLVSIWMRSDWAGAVMGCSFPPQYTLGTVGGQGPFSPVRYLATSQDQSPSRTPYTSPAQSECCTKYQTVSPTVPNSPNTTMVLIRTLVHPEPDPLDQALLLQEVQGR